MQRSEILTAMAALELYGVQAAFDESIATAIRRQLEPQRIIGELITAEITAKQARSIKSRISIAKLPLARDVDDFAFAATPINETLVRDLVGGNFPAHQRNAVLVGGSGTGKTHRAIAIARPCIRDGARPVLQRRRSGEQARSRGLCRAPGPDRRPSVTHGP
jgi:DNA replication protein DnaC